MAKEKKPGLDKLKYEVANEIGLDDHIGERVTPANYEKALDEFKEEVVDDLGLKEKVEDIGWENMTTKEAGKVGGRMGGKIGGNMVRKMIRMAQQQMAGTQTEATTGDDVKAKKEIHD